MPYTFEVTMTAQVTKSMKSVLDTLGIKYIIEGDCLIIPNEEVVKAEEAFQSLVLAQLAFRRHLGLPAVKSSMSGCIRKGDELYIDGMYWKQTE